MSKPFMLQGSLSALFVMLVAGCLSGSERAAIAGPATEEVVQAAGLAWAIANVETNLDSPTVYCIGLQDTEFDAPRDPPANLHTGFSRGGVPAQPVSECRFGWPLKDGTRYESEASVVIDQESERFGL